MARIRRKFLIGAGILAVLWVAFDTKYRIISDIHSNLYNQVRAAADTDGNNVLDGSEEYNVFRILGLPYDGSLDALSRLTIPQMRKYLANHSR